jgi:hypothetical protein
MSTVKPPIDQNGSPLFEAGLMYPLNDPTRYDDEYGEGYGFAAIDEDAIPGECWVHDCWIVNARGEKHPGLNECPVPIRRDAVDMNRGRPNPAARRTWARTVDIEAPTVDADAEEVLPRYALPRM